MQAIPLAIAALLAGSGVLGLGLAPKQVPMTAPGLPPVPDAPTVPPVPKTPPAPDAPAVPQPQPPSSPQPPPQSPSPAPAPQPKPAPAAPAQPPAKPAPAPTSCGTDYHYAESQVVLTGPAASWKDWAFPVECPVVKDIQVTLTIDGALVPGAYLDYGNQITLFDGAENVVKETFTNFNTGEKTVMFEYHLSGPIDPFEQGTWLLELHSCFLVGTYDLNIDVTY